MRPKISFAITTHNEGQYIQDLLSQLVPFCADSGDEIVVVDDNSDDETTRTILEANSSTGTIQLYKHQLSNNFADHKNYLNSKCTGDYIFQIDADETVNEEFLEMIHILLETYPEIELFYVPRVNIVQGLTDEDIAKWRWNVNTLGWINFPDYQTRLYKNKEGIQWAGKVHETIVGALTYVLLPEEERCCLYHTKTIDRQRAQNEFYEHM